MRAQTAEREVAAARQRESEHDKSLRLAAQEVDARQQAIHLHRQASSRATEQAGRCRAPGGRMRKSPPGRRKPSAWSARTRLSRRVPAARVGPRRFFAEQKRQAAKAVAQAEQQRAEAARAAEQSRRELADAASARKQEEARKIEQAQQRQAEERKFEVAVASRKAEEARLGEARAERARLDGERSKLESERAQLEASQRAAGRSSALEGFWRGCQPGGSGSGAGQARQGCGRTHRQQADCQRRAGQGSACWRSTASQPGR